MTNSVQTTVPKKKRSFGEWAKSRDGQQVFVMLAFMVLPLVLLFVFTYSLIYIKGDKSMPILFFAPFLISMGEMAFFSTNSYGLIMYFFIAIYLIDGIKESEFEQLTQEI